MTTISRDEIYEVKFWAIECPKCEEQIELESKNDEEIVCPFCGELISIDE